MSQYAKKMNEEYKSNKKPYLSKPETKDFLDNLKKEGRIPVYFNEKGQLVEGIEPKDIAKKKNITELYFAGVSGGCCVHYTAVDAMYRRIQPIMISDATSSPDPKCHKINLKNFTVFIGPVMITKQVITSLN